MVVFEWVIAITMAETNGYYFVVRIRRFLMTSDTIDILCLVHSNFNTNRIIFEVLKESFTGLKICLFEQKFK